MCMCPYSILHVTGDQKSAKKGDIRRARQRTNGIQGNGGSGSRSGNGGSASPEKHGMHDACVLTLLCVCPNEYILVSVQASKEPADAEQPANNKTGKHVKAGGQLTIRWYGIRNAEE